MSSALCVVLALLLGACSGSPLRSPDGSGQAAPGADGAPGGTDARDAGPKPVVGGDPGRVTLHRLNNLEYDNTVRDLLGVEAQARVTFQADERDEFDNNAEVFTINDARYEQYFNDAAAIAEAVFADATARARVVVCAPTDPADVSCITRIVRTLGLRAWRRPLTDDEVARFVGLAAARTASGHDFDDAVRTVVRALLSSLGFLYRIELDPIPTSLVPHAVAPYELASRLSYWLWSTMPDDRLFGLASNGTLAQPSVLKAELGRMLDDPRSATFVESFAGQWLGTRDLRSHQVEPTAFPTFDEPLRAAMAQEMTLYFEEFLRGGRPFDQFFDADVNFVNARLARHYGLPDTGLGDAPVRVTSTQDARKGFLGLAGWLTATSYAYRTDPRTRSRWIVSRLLCTEFPVADGLHLVLPPAETIREQVDATLAMPACTPCHKVIDPIGLDLEEFDAIGRFRTVDAKGAPIDTSSALPDGTKLMNELQLADVLAADPRFLDCASAASLTYALGRRLGDSDGPYLAQIRDAWKAQGFPLRALLEQIVLSDTFRFRRGEANP